MIIHKETQIYHHFLIQNTIESLNKTIKKIDNKILKEKDKENDKINKLIILFVEEKLCKKY